MEFRVSQRMNVYRIQQWNGRGWSKRLALGGKTFSLRFTNYQDAQMVRLLLYQTTQPDDNHPNVQELLRAGWKREADGVSWVSSNKGYYFGAARAYHELKRFERYKECERELVRAGWTQDGIRWTSPSGDTYVGATRGHRAMEKQKEVAPV